MYKIHDWLQTLLLGIFPKTRAAWSNMTAWLNTCGFSHGKGGSLEDIVAARADIQ
jgi:hypothetical protein